MYCMENFSGHEIEIKDGTGSIASACTLGDESH